MASSKFIKTSNLKVLKLNGIPFDHILTLHTKQSFNYNVFVNGTVTVKEPLVIKGVVNGLDLKRERNNTVMVD